MQTEFLDPANEREAVKMAARIVELKSLSERRYYIAQSPEHLRERIKYWVYTLWFERHGKEK